MPSRSIFANSGNLVARLLSPNWNPPKPDLEFQVAFSFVDLGELAVTNTLQVHSTST
jgi:hypothetical protein